MKIGIIGAMESEVECLHEQLRNVQTDIECGMTFYDGTLAGVPVVVVTCGIGKVNAALCAYVLISKFGVTQIINTGSAGALDMRLEVGDIVVSTTFVEHDMDLTDLGYEPGQIPDMGVWTFPADNELRAKTIKAAKAVDPEANVFEGRIASGDQFVSSEAQKQRITQNFGALCAEMEGAAVAHTCYLAEVPFVVVRAISDKADGSANVDFYEFEATVARRSALIVEALVCRLG